MDNRDNRPMRRGAERCSCRQENACGSDCTSLMQKLQSVDFAIIEVMLYLDSYPDSCEALALLNRLTEQRDAIAKAYESSCGPITAAGSKKSSWDWVNGPWPWELGFVGNNTRRR